MSTKKHFSEKKRFSYVKSDYICDCVRCAECFNNDADHFKNVIELICAEKMEKHENLYRHEKVRILRYFRAEMECRLKTIFILLKYLFLEEATFNAITSDVKNSIGHDVNKAFKLLKCLVKKIESQGAFNKEEYEFFMQKALLLEGEFSDIREVQIGYNYCAEWERAGLGFAPCLVSEDTRKFDKSINYCFDKFFESNSSLVLLFRCVCLDICVKLQLLWGEHV